MRNLSQMQNAVFNYNFISFQGKLHYFLHYSIMLHNNNFMKF